MSATLELQWTEHKIAGRRRRPRLALMALLTLICASLASALAWQRATTALDAALADRFSITQHVLSSEIGRLRYLPRVIAEDARLIAALAAPQDGPGVAAANAYLQAMRQATEADEAYLIGADGVTIAASNWNEEGSFVGAHYGFRPYFREAMTKGEGQYYAIGVTTGRPGVFLSARIGAADGAGSLDAGAVSGVAVVKLSLDALEKAWTRAGEIAAVTDADGVVFLSALPQWRFRSLGALTPEAAARIAEERRYASLGTGAPLGLEGRELTEPGQGRLRLWQGPVRGTDWQLIVALPVAGLREQVGLIALMTLTAGFLLSAFTYTIWQRRQILQLRLAETDRLEARVEERTRALAEEIEERRRTEAELRLAQENLVQATKLAVLGRMSAAIVHEVGQSLSALDNNLAVSELHDRAADQERLALALERSRRMVRRLQGVVTRLRSFGTRQVPVETGPLPLAPVVAVVAEIVAPRARELGVTLELPEEPLPMAWADGPRLEQVLSNLLLNAIDAAARGAERPGRVTLSVSGAQIGGRGAQGAAAGAAAWGAGPVVGRVARRGQVVAVASEPAALDVAPREGREATARRPGAWPLVEGDRAAPPSEDSITRATITLTIADTGPGIPAHRRAAVLEPFTGDAPEGMGLGLYIVQNFLEQMGGVLELSDRPGGGTLARVQLAAAPGPEPTA